MSEITFNSTVEVVEDSGIFGIAEGRLAGSANVLVRIIEPKMFWNNRNGIYKEYRAEFEFLSQFETITKSMYIIPNDLLKVADGKKPSRKVNRSS